MQNSLRRKDPKVQSEVQKTLKNPAVLSCIGEANDPAEVRFLVRESVYDNLECNPAMHQSGQDAFDRSGRCVPQGLMLG